MAPEESGSEKKPSKWEQGGTTGFKATQKEMEAIEKNYFIIRSAAIAGVFAGAVYLLDFLSGGKRIEDVGENKSNDEYKEINLTTIASNERIDWSIGGFNGSLRVEAVTDPDHVADPTVLDGAAREGGPVWMFDTVMFDKVNAKNNPAVSEVVLSDLSEQLKLDASGETELRKMYEEYLSNPTGFDGNKLINFMEAHGANKQVINFYRYAMKLKAEDIDKSTWGDRLDKLKKWESVGQIPVEAGGRRALSWARDGSVKVGILEKVPVGDNYFQVAEIAIDKALGNLGEALGILETAVSMPIDLAEMQACLVLDVADLGNEKPLQSSFSPMSLVLTGLLLLRFGPRWPKELMADASYRVEDIYYWIRLKQETKMIRNLTVLGQKFINVVKKIKPSVEGRQ